MTNFGDMKERLTDDLMVAASSTLFTTDRIEKLIQDAHLWATALYEWPQLQKAYDTVMPAVEASTNEQYIDYPENYRTDTISEFIYVDGKPYKRKAWNDYLEHKRLNPTSTKRVFADYGRQLFFFPHATQGVEVCLWGQIQATQITSDSHETIFSNHDDSGNEAIVEKALSVAMKRIDPDLAKSEEAGAMRRLAIIWDKVAKRQQFSQPLNKPMFNIPNFFAGGGGINPGNFSVDLGLEDN